MSEFTYENIKIITQDKTIDEIKSEIEVIISKYLCEIATSELRDRIAEEISNIKSYKTVTMELNK